MSPEKGGYVLMNLSQPLDDEIQVVLVYGEDVPRVLELCAQVGIAAASPKIRRKTFHARYVRCSGESCCSMCSRS